METPSQTLPKTPSKPSIQARAPKQASAGSQALPKERRIRGGALILAILMLIVGIAIGAFGMRARYSSQEVIAAVNGVTIKKEEFFQRLQQGTTGRDVLRVMVGEKLQDQFAEKQNKRTPKEEVEARYAEVSKKPGFQETLNNEFMTPGQFKDRMRRNMDRIAVLTKDINVTDAEIQTFYKMHTDPNNPQARFYTPAGIKIAAIVTNSKSKAEKARAKIRNGASFSAVAKSDSMDTSNEKGGELDAIYQGRTKFRTVKNRQGQTMEDALFRMKVGEISDPQEWIIPGIGTSWWIVYCLDKKPAEKKDFAEVKDEARMGAGLTKSINNDIIKKVEADFVKFQKEAKVQAFWPQYQKAISIDTSSKN